MIKFNKEVFEVFEEYKKADSRESRLDVLKKYEDNWAFKDILRGSFDESLEFHPEDAEYVLKMVAKKPPCRYITKKLIQEAFPNLIRE